MQQAKPPRLKGVAFFFKKTICLQRNIGLAKLLVLDNYDSFTYNLVQMFMKYELVIRVERSDMISFKDIDRFNPDYILISPGPRDPAHAGISIPLIKAYGGKIPILGVCLGMQCINEAFGGTTVSAPKPVHGKTSIIVHNSLGLFKGLGSPFKGARYHSLMVSLNQDELEVTSYSEDNVIMGLSHRKLPIYGVQFHPESFLTENGFHIVENFLIMGGL